jgi:transposase
MVRRPTMPCATAHYWARELTKLGHEVRLMPAKDVKAYVKRQQKRCG